MSCLLVVAFWWKVAQSIVFSSLWYKCEECVLSTSERSKGKGNGKEEEGNMEVKLWQKRKKSPRPQPGNLPAGAFAIDFSMAKNLVDTFSIPWLISVYLYVLYLSTGLIFHYQPFSRSSSRPWVCFSHFQHRLELRIVSNERPERSSQTCLGLPCTSLPSKHSSPLLLAE